MANEVPTSPVPPGQLEPGNIDLNTRNPVPFEGQQATVRSIGISNDKGYYNIPTVVGGKVVSNQEAVDQFNKTGEHLGLFDTQQNADNAAEALHQSEAQRIQNLPKPQDDQADGFLKQKQTEEFLNAKAALDAAVPDAPGGVKEKDPNDKLGIRLGYDTTGGSSPGARIGNAVIHGTEDFARNTFVAAAQLGEYLNEYFDIGAHGTGMKLSEAVKQAFPKADSEDTTGGNLIRGATTFLEGFIPVLQGLKAVTGGALVSKLGSFAQTEAAAAVTNSIVMDPHEARLSNLIQDVPALRNPVTEYLAAKPEDSQAEGRFKNAIEGLGLGAIQEGVFTGIKFIKNMRVQQGDNFETRGLNEPDKPVYQSSLTTPDNATITKGNFLTKTGFLKVSNGELDPKALSEEMDFDALKGSRSIEKAVKTITATRITSMRTAEASSGVVNDTGISSVGRAATADDQVVKDLATKIGWQPEQLLAMQKAMYEKVDPPLERIQALNTLLDASTEKLQATAAKASTSLDVSHLLDFMRMVNIRQSVQLWARGGTNYSTRLLKQFVFPEGSKEAQFAAVNEYMSSAGGAQKVQELATAATQVKDPVLLNNLLRTSEGGTARNLIESYWYFAMLSGLKTQVVNLAGSSANLLWQIGERALAPRISSLRGTVNGVSDYEAGAMIKGVIDAVSDGIRVGSRVKDTSGIGIGGKGVSFTKNNAWTDAAETWRTKQIDDPLARGIRPPMATVSAEKYGFTGPPGSMSWITGKALDGFGFGLNLPTRMLATADSFMRSVGRSAELRAQAYRKASADGITDPAEMHKVAQEYLSNPSKDMLEKSVDFSRDTVFAAPLGEWDKNMLASLNNMPIMKAIVPFYRISANMLAWVGKRTPLGFASGNIRNAIAKGGAEGDLALTRMAMGTSLGLVMANLAWDGYVTGSGPANPVLNATWKINNQPFSFRISKEPGSKWYSYSRMDPMGQLLGAWSSYGEIAGHLDTETAGQVAGAIGLATAKSVFNKNYISDVGQFLDAVLNPKENFEPWLNQKMGSFVPAGIAQVTQAVDPVWRETNNFIDSIKAKLPGFSETLPPHRNLWGEPIHLEGGLGPDLVSPVYTQQVRNDPASDYITDNKIPIGLPTKSQQGVELTPQEHSRLVELAGNALKHPVTHMGLHDALNQMVTGHGPEAGAWKTGSDGPDGRRSVMIQKMVQDYRGAAWQSLLHENKDLAARVRKVQEDKAQRMQNVPPQGSQLLPHIGG